MKFEMKANCLYSKRMKKKKHEKKSSLRTNVLSSLSLGQYNGHYSLITNILTNNSSRDPVRITELNGYWLNVAR